MLKKILIITGLTIRAACQGPGLTLPVGVVAKESERFTQTAPSKYNNKEIAVRGYTYGDVVMQKLGDTVGSFRLGEKGGAGAVSCNFSEKDATEFSKIKGLQYVTVKGIYHDLNHDLTPCTLVNVEPETNYPVKYVDRATAIPPLRLNSPTLGTRKNSDEIQKITSDQYEDRALTLLIEVSKNGKLYLNQDETGDPYDLTSVVEKLKAVFQEREKNGISKKEVVIDPKGFYPAQLNTLIERLAEDAKATSILVIKNDDNK